MRFLRLTVLTLPLAACSYDATAPARPGVVQATASLTFQPAQTGIRVNETVTWEFGAVPHNVTFAATSGRPADIPGLNTNTAVARTFTAAGTYAYECTLHPGMRGTVTVTATPVPPYAAPPGLGGSAAYRNSGPGQQQAGTAAVPETGRARYQ